MKERHEFWKVAIDRLLVGENLSIEYLQDLATRALNWDICAVGVLIGHPETWDKFGPETRTILA
jgi:hypothetical protein